ncbi:MAG: TonB-dependent receptor, partial [Myxococcota bacterium]
MVGLFMLALLAGVDAADTEGVVTDEGYQTTVTHQKIKGKDPTADEVDVSGEDLRKSNARDALQAISREVPGMYVNSRGNGFNGVAGGASGSIKMRGLGGSPNTEILILQDGVPDYQGLFGHPIPDAYVVDLVESVEVIRGGDSVLYGTNAMGGVINFKSMWMKEPGWRLTADSSIGSYKTFMENAAFLGKFGAFDTAGFVSATRSDGQRDYSGGSNIVGEVAGRWRSGDFSVTVREKLSKLTGFDPGPVTVPYVDHWYDVFRNNASAVGRYRGKEFKLNLTAYIDYGWNRLYDGFESHDYVAGGIFEGDFKLIKQLSLIAGISVTSNGGDARNKVTGKVENVVGSVGESVYAQFTAVPVKSLTLMLGGRLAYNPEWGFVPLYKAGAAWEFYPGLSVRARYITNYREPTIQERYLPFPVANPNLKPEYADMFDTGLKASFKHIEAELTFYYTNGKDLIRYFGQWPSAIVVNIDHAVFMGVEASVTVSGLGPFSFMLGADFQDVGRYTKQNPSRKVNASVEFSYKGWYASLTGQYVGGLYQNNYSRDPIPDAWF